MHPWTGSMGLATLLIEAGLTSWTTSAEDSVWDLGVSSTPSAGMQYMHRRLHFSVSEILR